MQNKIREYLKKFDLKPYRYTIIKNTFIIDTDKEKLVIKKRDNNRDLDPNKKLELFNYLKSRSFNNFPNLIDFDDDYEVYEYIDSINMPREQKAQDLVYLLSLLHNKTTYYKEINKDDYKAIYESINDNIEYLLNYYSDIMTVIESNVYFSPSEYLLSKNVGKLFNCIYFCKQNLDEWYKLIEDNNKQRLVKLHNNVLLEHVLSNNNTYLISWDRAKDGIPIYDLYNFYLKHYKDLDFIELFNIYFSKYPLNKEEKLLLFILLSIPPKIEFLDNEYDNTKSVGSLYEYINKSELLTDTFFNNKQKNNY